MKNDLEKFISGHRNEFDDAIPSGKVWENVHSLLEGRGSEKRRTAIFPMLKWSLAAGVLLLVSTGLYFIFEKGNTVKPGADVVQKDTLRDTAVPDEPEVYLFARLIAVKQEELKTVGKEQPELYRVFTHDLTQLDSSYKALKDKLSVSPNREMLIGAMIQNLQLQLNVLNQQLNIINQVKQSKNYSHEKNGHSI